mgnify:CR=1 FL=1
MKKLFFIYVLLCCCSFAHAQSTRKVGLFAPLYLDSVFKDNNYQYGKKFPRFALQGIDFVQGAQIALDSFPIANCTIDLSIFDSKADSLSVDSLINSGRLNGLNMIIGAIKDNELTRLAAFAKTKNIPFISATYPNDAGITANPNVVILNSTLKTHCEGIFSYLLQNNSNDNIIHVRQSGNQEDRVASYFNAINKPDNKPLLKIKTMNLDSNYAILKTALDSTRKNVIICGSLDEDFASAIAGIIASSPKKYDIMLIGMPNWESFGAFGKNQREAWKDLSIYYTSAYYNEKSDNLSLMLIDTYLKNYKGKPSEAAYKGFECMYLFSRLLNLYPENFTQHLNDHAFKVFSDFNFMPSRQSSVSGAINYYENKHLFFLKKSKGIVTKDW